MEKLNIAGVTLQGYAQGGLRTSIYCPEAQAVFDAGCVLPGVDVDHYFITHGHPDHIGALPYIAGKRSVGSKKSILHVHVPIAIAQRVNAVLSHMADLYGDRAENRMFQVHGVEPGEGIQVRRGVVVRGLETTHRTDSIGWAVEQTVSKLKSEFKGLAGHKIAQLRREGTQVTEDKTTTMLCVPGDTQIEFLLEQEQARKAKVLVHEVTVWEENDINLDGCRRYGHTHIAEMIEHCEAFEGEALVLCHRSMRWSRVHIEEMAKRRFPASMLPKIHFFDGGDRQ
jgi:ribonuclease Z